MTVDTARAYVGLFSPFRLRIARELSGLRKTDLAKRIGVTPAALTLYESGASKPSAAVLARLSFALGQSVEFFAQDRRSKDPTHYDRAFFRSVRATRQIDRSKATARAYLISVLVENIRRHVKLPKLNLPEDLHVPENATRELIEQRAKQLRAYWCVPSGPIANMVRLLESNGIVVTRCSMDCDEVDAFSQWFSQGPIVMLNSDKEHLDRLRFDAAHELGHLVLHAEVEAGNRILEEQAHQFASAFLAPSHEIVNQLPRRLDWDSFYTLKQTWGISVQALLRKCRDLGRMTEATYRRGMIILSQHGQRKSEDAFRLSGTERTVLLAKALEIIEQKGYTLRSFAKEARLQEAFVRETVYDEDLPVVDLNLNEPEATHI